MRKRGRTRKHAWVEFRTVEDELSPEARYLRWASVNNPALARCGRFGCPRCAEWNFRLRHDAKFENIRFYCSNCGFETSFHIVRPKISFKTIEVYDEHGSLRGVKVADDYHEKTARESADARVLLGEQRLDLGGEWFDGVSGTNSQRRYSTRDEIMKRIEERRMKRQMEAALEEIEREQEEDRLALIRAKSDGENIDY